jgi:diketogulonate reductase-like aldo/keto reductase
MNSVKDTYRLHNGVEIPCVGFGTWQTPDGEVAVSAVKEAIAAGYRHIDTAAAYENEESVGRAVRESEISRKDIFVTSKLFNPDHGYDKTMRAFEASLKELGFDYLDLYLIHWPNPIYFRSNWKEANAGSWKAFEELYAAGSIRAIGVSNFRPHHLAALMETARVKPMVNQIRLCPGDVHIETVEFCRKHDILLEAYSPLGLGRIMDVDSVQEIAQKHLKSAAQIALRWSLQKGFLPLPKSVTPERIRQNAELFDFALSDAEMAAIDSVEPGVCGTWRDPDSITF